MSEKVDIFMPLYIGDYMADTADLTTEEHGAYLLILMTMWRAREAIPLHRLRPIAKVATARWPAIWEVIERFFEVSADGLVTQGRLFRELEAALEKKRRASDRGRKGGLARAQAQADSEQGTGSTQAQEEGKPARLKVKVTDLDPIPSPDPSQQPHPWAPRARAIGELWTVADWRRKYGVLWCEKYGQIAMGGDGQADGKLREQLEALPPAARIEAQGRAPEMFAEFLAEEGEPAKVRHRWSWFVGRFESLRVRQRKPARAAAAGGFALGEL